MQQNADYADIEELAKFKRKIKIWQITGASCRVFYTLQSFNARVCDGTLTIHK